MASQTGSFQVVLDVTPRAAAIETGIGLAHGTLAGLLWTDLAAIVRCGPTNAIDVRNGSAYGADASMSYVTGTTYEIREVVDVVNHVYSVFIKPAGGSEVALANRYAFRAEQQGVLLGLASKLYNNIAYHNGIQGYEFNYYNCGDILKNNVSYNHGAADVFQSNQTRTNNSWQNGLSVSDTDFISVDGSELAAPRQADGNLPVIPFLHLASGSDLIGAGTPIPGLVDDCDGNPYAARSPSIGPFEAQ